MHPGLPARLPPVHAHIALAMAVSLDDALPEGFTAVGDLAPVVEAHLRNSQVWTAIRKMTPTAMEM